MPRDTSSVTRECLSSSTSRLHLPERIPPCRDPVRHTWTERRLSLGREGDTAELAVTRRSNDVGSLRCRTPLTPGFRHWTTLLSVPPRVSTMDGPPRHRRRENRGTGMNLPSLLWYPCETGWGTDEPFHDPTKLNMDYSSGKRKTEIWENRIPVGVRVCPTGRKGCTTVWCGFREVRLRRPVRRPHTTSRN